MFIRYFFLVAVIASFSTSLTLLPSASANPTPDEVDDFVHTVNADVNPLLYLNTEHLTSAQLLTFLSSVHSDGLNEANLFMSEAKHLRTTKQNVHIRQPLIWKIGFGGLMFMGAADLVQWAAAYQKGGSFKKGTLFNANKLPAQWRGVLLITGIAAFLYSGNTRRKNYRNETHMGQDYVYATTTEAGDCNFNFAPSTTDPYLLRFAITKCPQNKSAITGGIQLPSRSSEGPVVSFDEGRSYRFDVKTQKFVN